MKVLGLDVGGANTKIAFLEYSENKIQSLKTKSKYFPIWKAPKKLPKILVELSKPFKGEYTGVTLTAELSDIFPNKCEGVLSVLKAIAQVFDREKTRIIDVNGNLLSFEQAIKDPLSVAAANWQATVQMIKETMPSGILVDIGSTTTDIIPIKNGKATAYKTDFERLANYELVYTGLLRTSLSSITDKIIIDGKYVNVSAEFFAIAADIHLVLNNISPNDYTCDTPDNREKTKEASIRRLARVVCADLDQLTEGQIFQIAKYIYQMQVSKISEAISTIKLRDELNKVMVTGIGKDILGKVAAQKANISEILDMADLIGDEACKIAPAVGVALMVAKIESRS